MYNEVDIDALIESCNLAQTSSDVIELLQWMRSIELTSLIREWKKKPDEPRFSYNATCALMALTNFGMLLRKDRYFFNT